MTKNSKMYYVKHIVKPDADKAETRTTLKTITDNLYIYIPFKPVHFVYDNADIRKICGVSLLSEVSNTLAIAPELSLIKSRSKSGFNKLTVVVSKKVGATTIIKRAPLIFSKEFFTPQIGLKIAALKEVTFEKNVLWEIVAITGPIDRYKLQVKPVEKDEEEAKPNEGQPKPNEDQPKSSKDDGGSSSKQPKRLT